jgi:Acyl-protein synthetase, LuxE
LKNSHNTRRNALKKQILQLTAGELPLSKFEDLALQVFNYQYKYNAFYQQYCSLIGRDASKISQVSDIPFLPIQFFKNRMLKTGIWDEKTVFTSSGTTGLTTSSHCVRDEDFYKTIARTGFARFYGAVENYCVLGLLPSYLERNGSSLVVMTADFIQHSLYPQSGFFLNELDNLYAILNENKEKNIPTLLIGVTFALLDFIEKYKIDFPELIIMETGGMKGRRKEMIRSELHDILRGGFNVPHIHSEYGMTELLSQGYSKKDGIFNTIPTLKVLGRDINDPLSILPNLGRLSALNIVDLANLDTCSFIATDDLGRIYADGSFEILGRLDSSDIRGCNLLVV